MPSLPSARVPNRTGSSRNGVHLHPSLTTASEEYTHDIYRSVAEDLVVQNYLHQDDVFDSENSQWRIPHPATADGLGSSVFKIAESVISRLVKSTQSGVSRMVVGLQRGKSAGSGADSYPRYSPGPLITIRGRGPSFEDQSMLDAAGHAESGTGFSNVASYMMVRVESEVGTIKEVVQEMEPYARQIFAQQPNRLFVRCLFLTEKHARLIHFDRAGVETTPPINIHQHPATFVRLIVGLANTNERLLGLDDSIQWTIVDGRKDVGTLTMTNPGGGLKAYLILEHILIPRDAIPGRGTSCWRVQDPDTLEELVVKDSWRPDHLPPEHDLLTLICDLPGVVQMVSYEADRGETKDFRCPSTAGRCHNRVAMRITMKSYGRSIDFFTSTLQVLCAIRDAIAGHQRLVSDDLKILHRDISHNNILIGPEGVEGHRGVLIDLDAAFSATNECPNVTADFNIGTRIFQSLSVLSTYDMHGPLPAHDYLDDLESFFYVLVYTFLIHLPDGSRASSQAAGPSIVSRWENPNASIAWGNKSRIFSGRDGIIAARVVEQAWGPICASLYTKFSDWMSDTMQEKLTVLDQKSLEEDDSESEDEEDEDSVAVPDPFALFYSRRDEHYAYVLGIFDEAIAEIQTNASAPPPRAANQAQAPASATFLAANPSPDAVSTPVETTTPVTQPMASSALSVFSNPSSPHLKRRSEDSGYTPYPNAKARRTHGRLIITNLSP